MKSPIRFAMSRVASVALVLSLLTTSTPAAPQTIASFVKEKSTNFALWYNSGGLSKLVQGQRGPSPRAAEKQRDRDAKVVRLEIYPGNVTIDLSERVRFVAVPYDVDGNPVGGVKVKWLAQASVNGQRIRVSPQGELQPVMPGVFTITAQASGRSAQAIVTVRPGLNPNLNAAPTGSREVSSRDVPGARIGSNRGSRKLRSVSSKNAQSATVDVDVARRAHGSKALAVEPMPQGGGGGWDSSNYWSADDPENRVGDPPGANADGGSGSGNFQFAAPIYSAPGRGINISVGLVYNSRLWNKAGTQISYDNDHGWPAPGFNLGFGKLLGMGVYNGCMIVDADGTRHSYTGNITIYNWGTYGVMHTTDGSFIDYTYWTGTNGIITWAQAKLANGTIISYGAYSQAGGGVFPTSIEDANGNNIYITYLNNAGPRIQTVTDTLGRVINFHYDYNSLLTAVTAPGLDGATRTLVRLHYHQHTLNYGFSGLTPSVRDYYPWVIDTIYYPGTGTGYWLDSGSYSSYGMLAKVTEQRNMQFSNSALNDMGSFTAGSVTRQEEYNYDMTPNYGLTDAPTYTTMTERWTPDGASALNEATTNYEVHENDNPRTTTITFPNGTKSTQYSYNAPGSYLDGLVFEDRTFTNDINSPLQKSTSEWEQGAYGTPRPTRIEKFDERNQKTAAAFSYGSVYNQVIEVRDYDYGGSNLLRSTRTTYQNSTNYTGTCYSSGCFGRHIFNLPLTVEIYAADDVTRVARTEYQYDGQTLTAAPNVVMHNQAANPYADEEGFCYWDTDWNDPDCTGNCWEGSWNCDGYCGQNWVCPYDSSTTYRGNVTQVTTYADALNLTGLATETRGYDVTGNLVKASTSCCEQTTFAYSTDYQYAYPQSKTRGSATDVNAQVTTTAGYDFYTGLTTSVMDANNRPSLTSYDPGTLRVIRSVSPTNSHTDYVYNDLEMTVTTTTYLDSHASDATIADQNVKKLNGRGQVRQEKALGVNSVFDLVDTVYNQMGQVVQETKPYRSGETLQNTSVTYDALGRTKTVTAPDGSVTETFYNEQSRPDVASNLPGETTRVRDAWGRERWGRTDASGRLVEIVEPVFWGNGSVSAGMQTMYSYDTLGNLIAISSMAGAQAEQTRTFRYDSLGRLTAQKLAEMNPTLNDAGVYVGAGTWSDVFTYDNRSNLTSRTDARGVKTVYSYNNDPLNRLQSVSWDTSGFGDTNNPILPAATVTYQYRNRGTNTGCDPLDSSGRKDVTQLANISTAGVSTENMCFDPEGRVSSKTLTLTSRSGYPFATDYSYDELDRVKDVIYPNEYGNGSWPGPRKTVHQTYDIASRLSSLTFDGQTQASNITYNAASQTTSLAVGTGTNQVNENYGYNAQTGLLESQTVTRGSSTLLNLSYDYADANGKRTGQLTKIYNNLDRVNKDRGFEYDALGRLIRATGGQGSNVTWAQRYEYDRYGNRSNVYSYNLEDYVRNFYQGAMGTQPSQNWVQTQLSTLQSAYAQGQSQFLAAMQNLGEGLFSSPDYANRNRNNHDYVHDLYNAYLFREPDAGGWADWEAALNNGSSRAEVRNGFAWAPEFYTKVAGTSPYAPPSAVPRDGLQGIAYNKATNRIANDGWNYDAAGNQTRTFSNGVWQKYQYDAANRLVYVKTDAGAVIAAYTYGDSNERLVASENTVTSYYVGEGGATIAEYFDNGSAPVWSKSYVYLGNRLLSTMTPNPSSPGSELAEYDHPDRLGTRIITNPSTGSWSEQVTLPFGTALGAESSGTPSKRRFTSYERSDITKLDYAVNRHYDSQQGRFTQVDPAGMGAVDSVNPQTLNLYAYCANDPINYADPSGLGFFSKLWHAIKKIITSKWFMIAVAVAIIVIAHYYPHSIFGAIGGGSHAGGAAPMAHGAGATTGLGAASGATGAGAWTASELAMVSSAAGWTTGTAGMVVFSVSPIAAATSGVATAVSLGLAGAAAAGLVAGLQNQVPSDLKQQVQKTVNKCSDYMDSLLKQLGSKYTSKTFGDLFDRVGLGRIKIDPTRFGRNGVPKSAAGLAMDSPRRIFINGGVTGFGKVTTFELLHHASGSGMYSDYDLDKAVIKLMSADKQSAALAQMNAKGYQRSTIAHRQLNENCFAK